MACRVVVVDKCVDDDDDEESEGLIHLVPFKPSVGPLPLDTTLLPPRKTRPYLEKFEKSRILMRRAVELSVGSDTVIEVGDATDPLLMAKKEFRKRVIPVVIRRLLSRTICEDWCLAEQLVCCCALGSHVRPFVIVFFIIRSVRFAIFVIYAVTQSSAATLVAFYSPR
jgi:DNA-directed RNA polymerase subunit K/omega